MQQFGAQQDQFNMGAQQFGMGQQQFQMGSQQFEMDQQARNQGITEYLAQRQTPLNEINALMSGSQVSNPFAGNLGYQAGSNVAPAPIFDAARATGQAEQAQYDAKSGSSNSMMGGLFGLGGAAIMGGAVAF